MVHKGQFFAGLAKFYLCEYEHLSHSGETYILRNWDVYLNVLNIEAEKGSVTAKELLKVFFGYSSDDIYQNREARDYYHFISADLIMPLHWLGLLDRVEQDNTGKRTEAYRKSRLWEAAMVLDEIPDFIKPSAANEN